MQPPRIAFALTLTLLALSAPRPSSSAPAPAYERERVDRALAEHGWTRVEAPEGKRIGQIHLVRRDVLADDEPIPTFFNAFHWLTEGRVVRRELLFKPGAPWDAEAVAESERNLRKLGLFAIVKVAAVEGSSPDTVDAVVFTRDLWSVRLESSFRLTAGHLDKLALTLAERNLFGEGKLAALRFDLRPKTFSLGEFYDDRRLLGGALSLNQSFDLIFNRADGAPEGSRGSLSIGKPLRTLSQRWGWELGVGYAEKIGRQLSGSELLTYDIPETETEEQLPRRWDLSVLQIAATVRRQTGDQSFKHQLSFGFAGSDLRSDPLRRDHLDADAEAAFRRDVLPPQRRQIYPFFGSTGFVPDYETFNNLASFGLSEDIRLGPWWSALVRFPLEAFGSSDDALTYQLYAGAVTSPAGGLLDLRAGLRGRLEQSELIDQVYELRLRCATSQLLFGRLIARAHLEARRHDTSGTLVTLGGDSGLRGYPSQAFYGFGASRLRFNIELRTPPVVIASARIGAVVFWDAGTVYERLADFRLRQSAGVGLRLLFPQFNRYTFRLDFGVPFDSGGFQVLVNFGSQQAVPLTYAEDLASDE